MDIVATAYDKAGLSESEAQNVNNASGLADHIGDFIAKNRTREEFANEETESNYGYLSGYKPGIRGLTEQCNQLRILFPGIGFANQDLLKRNRGGRRSIFRNMPRAGSPSQLDEEPRHLRQNLQRSGAEGARRHQEGS